MMKKRTLYIFLDCQQKEDSLILKSNYESNFKGIFKLKLVSKRTSAIGVWESAEGKIKDVTVHKTNSKEWAQGVDRKLASKITAMVPFYKFSPSNIIKLNAMRFKNDNTSNGLTWKSEVLSNVRFPRTQNEALNQKLEGLHYNFATQVLNAYKGSNGGSLHIDCTVLMNSASLLSLKVEIVDNAGFGKNKTNIITYLFDKVTGQFYKLEDVLLLENIVEDDFSSITNLALKDLLNKHYGNATKDGSCNYEDWASIGLSTWALTENELLIIPSSSHQFCNKSFSIKFDALNFQIPFKAKILK